MRAFEKDPALHAELLEEIAEHRRLDMIASGTYGDVGEGGKWRGCAVGCSIHSLNKRRGTSFGTGRHSVYETEFGIPEELARLQDAIFEGMPSDKRLDFPLRFMQAIAVGADLTTVADRMKIFILQGIRANAFDDGKAAIDLVIGLLNRRIAGEEVPDEEWSAAESAAQSARSAAQSAQSAGSAAQSARSAARSAAGSAAQSAESAKFDTYADKLCEILSQQIPA